VRKLAFVVLIAAFVLPASAQATFPGANGKIAFVRGGDIWTMNPDGTSQVNVTNDAPAQSNPSWSADGNKIAFDQVDNPGGVHVWSMFADGTGRLMADDSVGNIKNRQNPAWNPAGTRIVFTNGPGIFSMNPDGSQVFGITVGNDDPDWSPAGDLITYEFSNKVTNCAFYELDVVHADGTGAHEIDGNRKCEVSVAGSSFSPDSQKIAFYNFDEFCNPPPAPCDKGLKTVNTDGTNRQDVPGGGAVPVYSPDGTRFAYAGEDGIHTMNTNGTGDVLVAPGTLPSWQPIPASRPAADVLATITDSPDPVRGGDELHYTASAKNLVGPDPGSGVTLSVNLPANVFFVSAAPTQGSCSQSAGVVTCNFGALPVGGSASVDIDVEPNNVITNTTITATANATANETDPVPGNNSASTTTTVVPGAYARPMGATPLRAALVPSFKSCGSEATLQHGAPLSYPSCGNPQLSSGTLTIGSPDSNGQPANSVGSVKLNAIGEGPPINPNNGDQADLGVSVSMTDVRNKSNLSDYTGELQVDMSARVTDHDNGSGGFTSATMQDITLDFTVPCGATVPATTGSLCVTNTTQEAVVPGSVKEMRRMVWQLGQIRVLDGGPDGVVSTANNTLFAVQGVFVP
jgi:Tol biopolymer transport system component